MSLSVSVRARILLTVALGAGALLAVGLLGYRTATSVNATMKYSHETYFLGTKALSELNVHMSRITEQMLVAVVTRTPEASQSALGRIDEDRKEVSRLWKWYVDSTVTDEDRRLGQAFIEARAEHERVIDGALQDIGAGRYDAAAEAVRKDVLPRGERALAAVDALVAYNVRMAEELQAEAGKTFISSTYYIWTAIFAGVALASLAGWLLARSIMGSLDTARQVARRIAAGRLGDRIEITSNDEFGELLRLLASMDAKLTQTVSSVRGGAEVVGSAARELAQGNDDLSQRTQEQASALQETAASMEQMTANVKRNAENAQQANQLAIRARERADKGTVVVREAIDAMNKINASSKRIADIIGVIDEIAFQTNLLALNAAVEAARAGEQGRGFAVVAAEVRQLAQRSGAAAKEIKEMIKDSVDKVHTGSELVNSSGTTLTEILDGIRKVSDIVAEISAANAEQSSGIDQVNDAVMQMDQATQQNAAVVEEISSASKSMEQQAHSLVEQIAFFQVANGAQQPVPVISQPMTHVVHERPSLRSAA
ncbi:MAG TPA: methyl-accepting chemotaxis protein [Steroidobacteraceae bacterium]|jgi:methyl-accepting chemotaxis protein-1 (serine sensor receptor)